MSEVAKKVGTVRQAGTEYDEDTYVGLTTSKVLPSTALTNLLFMNRPVLPRLAVVLYLERCEGVYGC